MPKYLGKQIFKHGEKEKEKKTMVITMAKLCMAHESTQAAWANFSSTCLGHKNIKQCFFFF